MAYNFEYSFTETTALVTGATSGIGAETAIEFGRRGAFVFVHCCNGYDAAGEVLERIRELGGDGLVLRADLSSQTGVDHLIAQVTAAGRPIDILINNAGSLIRRTPVLEFTPELWEEVLTLNLTSAFFISQAVLPGMVERGRGAIVNIGSLAARNGGGIGAIAYASAKAALSTMTKGLAREFAPKGIHVNAVSPGTIDTNYHRKFSSSEALVSVVAATPMGRLGLPCEVAGVVVFLCSEAARFIQGQVIEVNGGFLMA